MQKKKKKKNPFFNNIINLTLQLFITNTATYKIKWAKRMHDV